MTAHDDSQRAGSEGAVKTKYIITRGSYDDYGWIAHIEGESEPALSELFKQFCDEYSYVPEPYDVDSEESYALFEMHLQNDHEMYDRVGMSGQRYFVQWLKEKHGFVDVEIREFHV